MMFDADEKNPSCKRILLSWVFVALGMFAYEKAGMLAMIFPFAIGAFLRGEQDSEFFDKALKNIFIVTFSALYYVLLGIFAVFKSDIWVNLPVYVMTIMTAFPFIIAVLYSDIRDCVLRKYK